MTVTAQTLAVDYSGNGLTTTFAYPFRVLLAAQVAVYVNGVKQSSGYTVNNVGNQGGGTVVFAAAPAAGSVIRVQRETPRVRTADFQPAPYFTQEELLDFDQDYQTMILQEAYLDGLNSIHIPRTEEGFELTLPPAAGRARKAVVFDNDGSVTVSQDDYDDQAFNSAVSAQASAASAFEALQYLTTFRGTFYGPLSADPTLDPNGAAPTAGDIYYNTTTGIVRVRTQAGSWADAVTAAPASFNQNLFTGTGAQTTFALSPQPASTTSVIVSVNGLVQRLTTDYSISGTNLVFVTAPANGASINVLIFAPVNVGVPNDASVTTQKIADLAVTPAKLSTGAPSWTSGGVLTPGGAVNERAAQNVAVAGTIDLTNTTSNYINITGTGSIGTIIIPEGTERILKFPAGVALFPSANLIFPTAMQINTSANDIAVFRGDTGNRARIVSYIRGDSGGQGYSHGPTLINQGGVTTNALPISIPAGVARVIFEMEPLGSAGSTGYLGIQFSYDNGVTYDTTTTYLCGGFNSTSGGLQLVYDAAGPAGILGDDSAVNFTATGPAHLSIEVYGSFMSNWKSDAIIADAATGANRVAMVKGFRRGANVRATHFRIIGTSAVAGSTPNVTYQTNFRLSYSRV